MFACASSDQGSDEDESKPSPGTNDDTLANKLQLQINLQFTKGQEADVANAAQACSGPVLIAWQHEVIYEIAKAIPGGNVAPQKWPGERFDIVFVLTLKQAKNVYSFAQVPQRLLAGDSARPWQD